MTKNWAMMWVTAAGVTAVVVVSGCAKQGSSSSSSLDSNSDTLAAESVVAGVNGAMNDNEQSTSYASAGRRGSFLAEALIPSAYAASCGLNRFSPSIGSADCSGTTGNETVLSSFNGCTAGERDEFILNGTIQLSFDQPATCDTWIKGLGLPTSGSVTRTTSDFTRTNPNGSKVLTSSASHQNYLSQTVGGGVKTSFGAGSRTIDILGLHRTSTLVSGSLGFDHSLHTLQPLVVSGTRASGNRLISSGEVQVDHNRARFSMNATISNLGWSASCCYPSSGTVSFKRSGSLSGTMTVDFNTGSCGEVMITRSNGDNEKVELASCE